MPRKANKFGKERYARKTPKRQGSRVLIVVEGECEKLYFEEVKKYFRLTGASVEISDQALGTDPKNLLGHARIKAKKADRENQPFDEIWLVYDLEDVNHIRRTQASTLKQSKDAQGISFAESDLTFEYWIILHFEYTTKSFSVAAEVERYLKENHWPNYVKVKGSKPSQEILAKILTKALPHAQMVRKNLDASKTMTPRTNVDCLIASLLAKSQDARSLLMEAISKCPHKEALIRQFKNYNSDLDEKITEIESFWKQKDSHH